MGSKIFLAFFWILVFSVLCPAQQLPGYVVAGYSRSYTHGGTDVLVYQLDLSGRKAWRRNLGGIYGDIAYSICQTNDGGFIVAGETTSFTHGSMDFLIYKLDSRGLEKWRRNYGGIKNDIATSVKQTSNGNYIVAGWSNSYTQGGTISDFLVYKLNAAGRKLWRYNYGGVPQEVAWSVIESKDNSFCIAGPSRSFTHGLNDFLVYKIDTNGSVLWQKNYGGEIEEYAHSIYKCSDGGFIIAGNSNTYTNGDMDFLVYKVDSSGKKRWRKNYGGEAEENGWAIQQTNDGGYVVAGNTRSYTHGEGDIDFLVYKLNSVGGKQWRKNFGGIERDVAAYECIVQTADGGYILCGSSYTYTNGEDDFLVYKLDSQGTKQWRRNYGGIMNDNPLSIKEIFN